MENEELTGEAQETTEKKSSLWKELLSWLEIIVVAVVLSLFLTRVVLVNALVPSSSMEMLISPGDRLFGNRLTYKFKDPERFDVVIFKYPVDEEENYIKRIIGLPGDTVTIEDAKIYINDSETPLEENYLPEEWVVENDGYVFEVPEDCYLMLGDNRNNSTDSRVAEVGNIKRDDIIGRAWLRIWPFDNFGVLKHQ